jgi:hypothetical protein
LRSDESRYVSAESAMFAAITDDQGGPHWLEFVSRGASSSGQKRQRWDLRTLLRPTPAENVKWLRFETPHGPITSRLLPPTAARISTEPLVQERNEVEYYLAGRLYNHVWLHLLDPERLLAGLSVIGSALVAVDAIRADDPLVVAVAAVDGAIAGAEAPSIPPVLADALARRPPPTAWVGASAVGVTVSHPDAGQVGLEALVGHRGRFARHFIDPGGGDQIGVWGLIVAATDDHGRGHVAHPEPLSSMEEGALHFRPPLAGDAAQLTIRLEGPRAAVNVTIDLADNTGVAPGS